MAPPWRCRTRFPAWAPTCCRCARASAWGRAAAAAAPAFKIADAAAIASQIGGVRRWRPRRAPAPRGGQRPQLDQQRHRQHQRLARHRQLEGGQGRDFSDDELRAGGRLPDRRDRARELFGSAAAVGQQLRVKQFSCEIIGLLASKGQGAFGNDQDDMVLVPLKTLQRRITGNNGVNTLLVSMQDGSDHRRASRPA
jgi:putative ABC transport system permease protein